MLISTIILPSIQQPHYHHLNLRHFRLSPHYYTHFTSPIPPYPHLTLHTLIPTYLIHNSIDKNQLPHSEDTFPQLA
ncbi:RNB domain-containing ribonuclease, partial [Staphylococcus capitis]|uniref:RNB domain-containing ribonuclease n=1 Tax=Staphylococcus capitis TaxID=29388 RepID=UPI003709ABD2